MIGMSSKKSVIGLDIGAKTTKVAQLKYTGTDKPILERCDLIQTGFHDEEFHGNLKAYLRENKIGNALVASSIDDPSMKIRKLQLPKMPDLDLVEAIKWNMRDVVDGDVEEFAVDFSRIEEFEEGDVTRLDIMAYAVKKSVIHEYKTKIESLGLQPFFIEPASVTLASTLDRCSSDDQGYLAGVDIGYSKTLFYVIGKGVLVFSRPVLGVNMEAQAKDPGKFFQKLAIEIQKSIDTFKVNFKMEEIRSLKLTGGGALLDGVSDYLKKNLGVETTILNPLVTLSHGEKFSNGEAALFAQAVSLAYLQP